MVFFERAWEMWADFVMYTPFMNAVSYLMIYAHNSYLRDSHKRTDTFLHRFQV